MGVSQEVICIKQYGDHKTGTNYLWRLLRVNWPNDVFVATNVFGWKHGVKQDEEEWFRKREQSGKPTEWLRQFLGRINYTVQVRDPYTWFPSRLKSKKYTTKRGLEPADVARLLNKNCASWRELLLSKKETSIIVKFEDLISCPGDVLQSIQEKFGLPDQGSFEQVLEYVAAGGKTRTPDFSGRKRELLQGGRTAGCTEVMHRTLNEHVDWDLMGWYGYEPVPLS